MSHVPYASVVGSLMYAMVCTRLDIAHAVGVLTRYMSKLLDTTPTLRGGVNQCVDTYTNFSHFSQQSFITSSYRQHLLIINAS